MTRTSGPTAYIYRCYDDEGALLYVGLSRNVGRRMAEHERTAPWWRWVADVTTYGPIPTADALTLEARLIRRMSPVFNRDWNTAGAADAYVARRDPAGAAALIDAQRRALASLRLPSEDAA